ncbi:MAG TPA: AmmeMemoRadiSam system protein B [Candidatus Acidoferrales bacterium]|nr:AmmeMemoRadiSam system protein B [Candidatus Acidoferrales bacterium]
MAETRAPAVAGSFYPAAPQELRDLLRQCFFTSPLGPRGPRKAAEHLFGGMVPHAGYIYSGPCAAHFYALLEKEINCAVILGVNHAGIGAKAALSAASQWETPLGSVAVDTALEQELSRRVDFLRADERAHRAEHSIEVQLPFLQSCLPEAIIVPISLGRLAESACERLGRAVAEIYETRTAAGRKTIVIASSDLSHYRSPEETERLDAIALERVLALDPSGLLRKVEEEDISMCGVIPTAVLLYAARALGAREARLLKHCHSGDAVPMPDVVGYASVAIEL